MQWSSLYEFKIHRADRRQGESMAKGERFFEVVLPLGDHVSLEFLNVVDLTSYMTYIKSMSPRTGRPRTGERPNLSIRMHRAVYHEAKVAAVISGKTVGVWLEEAIREKIGREQQGGHNVSKTDS